MSKRIEMEGKKFGMLTVKSYSHTNERRSLFWNCICECGNLKVIEGSKLREGSIISCGCQKK